MRLSCRLGAALALLATASCVPRTVPEPAPPPPPRPAPEPPPPPPPPRPAPEWEDAELTAGDWRLLDGGPPAASYGAGAPVFVIRCEPGRRIALVRAGGGGSALTIRTSYGARALPAAARAEGLVASVAASDPLLDAIAFSRGRFAVEAEGQPRLVLPAWPEPARVIEECRS